MPEDQKKKKKKDPGITKEIGYKSPLAAASSFRLTSYTWITYRGNDKVMYNHN